MSTAIHTSVTRDIHIRMYVCMCYYVEVRINLLYRPGHNLYIYIYIYTLLDIKQHALQLTVT